MSLKEIAKIVEGVLFVSGEGVSIEEFKSRFEMNDREFNKCLDILKENGAMATTSVNISGMPPLDTYQEIYDSYFI